MVDVELSDGDKFFIILLNSFATKLEKGESVKFSTKDDWSVPYLM